MNRCVGLKVDRRHPKVTGEQIALHLLFRPSSRIGCAGTRLGRNDGPGDSLTPLTRLGRFPSLAKGREVRVGSAGVGLGGLPDQRTLNRPDSFGCLIRTASRAPGLGCRFRSGLCFLKAPRKRRGFSCSILLRSLGLGFSLDMAVLGKGLSG